MFDLQRRRPVGGHGGLRQGGVLLVALFLLAILAPAVALGGSSYPASMASTGDSLTRAATTGLLPWTDNPSGSWSTGTDSRVNSHYLRLLALTPRISGHNYNDARSGARMGELSTQMGAVISQKADYVTVEMGGNDVCRDTESQMTPVATYRSQFQAGLERVTKALPSVKVFVASVPDVYQLWALYHDNLLAQVTWASLDVCQTMLANPTSTATADVERRSRVRQRILDYNTQLAEVCTLYRQCRFDQNAAFNYRYTTDDVGHWDYFHPSLTGQAHFAAGTWAYSFWAP